MHHHYKKGVFGMAKKGWGKFVAFAAVTGAVAAGVSYVLQYKTYHRELEKDFREFEDGGEDRTDEDGTERTIDARSLDRNYISLSSSKDEFKVAAKDMAQATKNVLKDVIGHCPRGGFRCRGHGSDCTADRKVQESGFHG